MTNQKSRTERAHTPGPWEVGFPDGSGQYEEGERGAWIQAKDTRTIVQGGQSEGIPIGVLSAEDARLIAAAPELLEVARLAQDVVGKHNDHADYEADFVALRAALLEVIVKAEGR